MPDVGPSDVRSSDRIGRNTLINFGGAVVPILISLLTVPAYLHLIGEARYGILAVIWVVFGYFGVFEFGLSRATANQIARMRHEPAASRESVFWTALTLNAAVGVIGGVALFLAGQILLGHAVKISADFRSEAVAAVPWLAAGVPATTVSLVLAGTLEGRERFLTVNLLTLIAYTAFQVAPLGYAYWIGPNLVGLVKSAMLALLATTALSFVVTAIRLPVTGPPHPDRARVGALFRYGGWVAVSGLVGPFLTVVDRVLIGSVFGAKSVTRYTVPFTLVSRVQILAGSLARTLFPRLSMLDEREASGVGQEALRALVTTITPLTVTGAVLLEPFLRVWVGARLTRSASPVGEILLIGMWLNSLALIPYAFLQARDRPDLTAKFHLAEVLPYMGALILGLQFAGIQGAAWAWAGRAGVDLLLLLWAAQKISRGNDPADYRVLAQGGTLVTVTCLLSLTVFGDPTVRILFGGALIVMAFWWSWRTAPAGLRVMMGRFWRAVSNREGRRWGSV